MHQPTKPKRQIDPLLWLISGGGIAIAGAGFLFLGYLFVTVYFTGGSSECPMHNCQ